ncbi:hypothetical protein ACFFGH_10635 [Lysobacter korlensis]|uniref:Uncharacterized protein n=1 Tax=Lysobacter korlensis TaxID=553636 RepID=A0ABV6RMW0_9GAMM
MRRPILYRPLLPVFAVHAAMGAGLGAAQWTIAVAENAIVNGVDSIEGAFTGFGIMGLLAIIVVHTVWALIVFATTLLPAAVFRGRRGRLGVIALAAAAGATLGFVLLGLPGELLSQGPIHPAILGVMAVIGSLAIWRPTSAAGRTDIQEAR